MLEETASSPAYTVSALGPEEITAPDGTVIPTESYQDREEIRVLDGERGELGCCLYRMDGELWLGYGDAGLEALFRLTPEG